MVRKQMMVAALAGMMGWGLTGTVIAQDAGAQGQQGQGQSDSNRGDRGGDRGGDRSDRGRWDPAQFRQRIAEMMKQRLEVNDEEWKVLEPRLEKVMTLSRDTRGGGMMFGRGPSGPGAADRGGAESQAARAGRELRSALEDKSIGGEEITRRLEAYRQAREQSKQELVKAQQDLKEILTPRQEAQLVSMGMLD